MREADVGTYLCLNIMKKYTLRNGTSGEISYLLRDNMSQASVYTYMKLLT